MKKLAAVLLVISLAFFFAAGCVEQKQQDLEGAKPVENLVEDDNLDAALDELGQLEELYGP
jgi:hypothetical protein